MSRLTTFMDDFSGYPKTEIEVGPSPWDEHGVWLQMEDVHSHGGRGDLVVAYLKPETVRRLIEALERALT